MDNFKTSKLEKSSKIRKSIDRNVPYNVPGELIEVFEDFFESNFRAPSNEKGTTLFAILLNHRKVSSSDDFSDETFYIDFKMASSEFISFRGKSLTGQEKSMLKNLYSYLLSNYPDNFETLTLNVINHNNTFRLINENYKIVKRNIFDELPTDLDKWIYLDNENIYNIDFTLVEQEKMRNGLKSYFWYDTSSKTDSKYNVKLIAITAMCAALITVTTAFIKIPSPLGYSHAGDSMIYLAASILPGPFGIIASSIGGALADLISGYPHWAIPTAIIKAVNAVPFVLCRMAMKKRGKDEKIISPSSLLMLIPTTIVTIGGYFIANGLMYDFGAAIAELPTCWLQPGVGALIYIVVGIGLDKINFKKKLSL